MVRKIFAVLFSILFLTVGLIILPKPEKEKNNMAETWVLNEEPIFSEEELRFNTVFTTNNTEMRTISIEYIPETPEIPGSPIKNIEYTQNAPSGIVPEKYAAYDSSNGGWTNTAYRTLIFETAPTGDLLTWLQANGTKQETDTSKKLTKLRYKVSDVCQLFDKDKYFATRTAHGVVFTNNGDGSFTINGTCDSDADADTPLFLPPTGYSITFDLYSIEGHKYLLIPLPQTFSYSTLRFIFGSQATPYYETSDTYKIYTATKTGTFSCYAIYRVGKGTTINNLTVKPQLFDLTEMYGAGNEPTTLAEFRQKYPNELYPYSPQCWLSLNKTRYMSNQYGNSVLTNSIYVNHKDSQKFFYITGFSGSNLYKRVAYNAIPKMGLLDYKVVSNADLYDGSSGDKTVSLGYPGMYDNFIMVRDLSFNGDFEKFKQFIIGNNVWFELETPAQGGYLPLNKGVKL